MLAAVVARLVRRRRRLLAGASRNRDANVLLHLALLSHTCAAWQPPPQVAAVELRMATLRLLSWWAEVEAWLRGNSAAMEERRAAAAAALDAPAP